MDRRKFIRGAGLAAGGLAATTIAAPAIADNAPKLKWRLTSSFPQALDALFGAAKTFADAVSQASDGNFQIEVFSAGELGPPLKALDMVSDGTVEISHTASYYYWGKDPTFAIGTAIPFGLNSRQENAWMYFGGGIELMNAFFKKYGVYGLPGGNTGAQMGGWYRKPINTPADFSGLKMRIAGLAGAVMAKLGVVPQQIAGADIYPSLEKGTIDAAEWVGPYDDEKLGLYKVAKYYYYPAWWEGGAMLHFFIGLDKWNALPKSYQSIITSAAALANVTMQARYDAINPGALRQLVAGGAVLSPFPATVMEACFKAANEVYGELSAQNSDFNAIYEALKSFRNEEYLWFQVADGTYDNFMFAQQQKGAL